MMFFELIQVALGKRDGLSKTPTFFEWKRLYEEAQRQSVLGIVFEGVQKLPREQWPSQALLFPWIGFCEQIKQRNAILNARCEELLSKLSAAGLHPTILKGQGVAKLYPEAMQGLRQSGDIDVYVSDGMDKAIDYARSTGQKNVSWDYKHLHLQEWKDTQVELHYHVEVLLNPRRNKKLQQWFKKNEALLYFNNEGLVTPTIEMNVFYVFLHIYRHFFTEGVGLRQLLDYYYVLKAAKGRTIKYADGSGIVEVLKEFGMLRFAKGVMWIMQEIFALDSEYLYCEPSAKEGRFILKMVMKGGNFGYYKHTNVRGLGKLNTLLSVTKHNLQMMYKYPSEALHSPLWYIWHKWWKHNRS